jgi:hypothetical protein
MWESEEAQSTKKEYEAAIASGGRTGT